MSEQEQHKKYTTKDVISLNLFLFVWITGAITLISFLFELLPDHYFVYGLIQGAGYFAFYKLSKYLISNNIHLENNSDSSCEFDSSKRLNDDISCGISPYNYRHETNLNTTSSISSSSYSSTSNSSSVYNSLSNNR